MKMTFTKGELAGKSFEYSSSTVTIGRELDNVMCLETGGVSRYHALISCIAGSWSISDLNSTNGIKINGVQQKTSKLKDGDVVTIGEHSFSVSGLDGTAAPEVNINISSNSSTEPQAADADVLEQFKEPLFNRDSEAKKENVKEKKDAPAKKLFSNRLYYTIIACLAVMGITTAVKMFSNSSGKDVSASKGNSDEQIETVIFERVKYFDANVFRFTMKLDGNKVVFTVDDAATERHSKEITVNDPAGIDLLKNQIIASGVMTKKIATQPGSRNVFTRFVLVSDKNCVEHRIDGEAMPSTLSDIAAAIDEFAENCGMITVSRTSEEIMQIASENFNKAEDLFSNFEAAPENLRDAISRYKIAVRYLSQYSPPPPMAKQALKQLLKAEELRNKLLSELRLAEDRCLNTSQLDELKTVYRKMLALTEPGTKAFDRTKRKLFKLDRALSKMGDRR